MIKRWTDIPDDHILPTITKILELEEIIHDVKPVFGDETHIDYKRLCDSLLNYLSEYFKKYVEDKRYSLVFLRKDEMITERTAYVRDFIKVAKMFKIGYDDHPREQDEKQLQLPLKFEQPTPAYQMSK